jgi:hypothetical protein
MPIIFSLFSTVLFALGFYFCGKLICNYLKLDSAISIISKPYFQYSSIGISFFLIILYPFVFFIKFPTDTLKYFSSFILLAGLVFFFYNFINIGNLLYNLFYKFKRKELDYKIISTIIILYFFLSLAPITDSDSLAYHLPIAKNIMLFGQFPFETYNFTNTLGGIGELLIALSLSVSAEQFGSFINFIGLVSILGLLEKLSINKNLQISSINYYLVLSCPILVFLISSAKPQFFYVSLVSVGYAFLLNINKFNRFIEIKKIFILVFSLSIVALNAKINFTLSYFLINLGFIIFFFKKIKIILMLILINLIIFVLFLFPILIHKSQIYNYPFYYFLTNPLPLNIPGFADFFLMAKNYNSEHFFINLIFPTSFSSITNTFGLCILILPYLLFKKFFHYQIYFFLFFFYIVIYYFNGQNSVRFYLEIYIFLIFIFAKHININNNKFLIIYKKFLYLQTAALVIIISYGVLVLFQGSLTLSLKEKTLGRYADGYLLYNWTNQELPNNAKFLTNHRSVFFSKNKPIFADFTFLISYDDVEKRNYMLNQIISAKPEFILFYGSEKITSYGDFEFINCSLKLISNKNEVGYLATRNIFNTKRILYNGYLYEFDYSKMPSCVTKKK